MSESRSMRRPAAGLTAAVAALSLVLAGCGTKRGGLIVGGVEDAAKWSAPAANMQLAREAGFRAIVLSSVWARPLSRPAPAELSRLRAAVDAAERAGIRPIVAVYSFSANTPTTGADRAEFASYAAAILTAIPELRDISIGNEPNSNRFWMPQFGPDGSDAAAPAYFALLSETYDLLKRVAPRVSVIGGSLAARGADRPQGLRQTHSATRFIEDLGAAYRAGGRSRVPLDMFSIHPYPANSRIPPTARDPHSTAIGIADYPKLVRLLRGAFGTPPPIVYGEYGVETRIPRAELDLYTGTQPRPVDPVGEQTQATDYVEAIRLAACQPLVRMLIFFHVTDESQLVGLQTGLFYPNDSPKRSLPAVAASARAAEAGQVKCGA